MARHDAIDNDDIVLDPEREWGVYRCSHGCVHLAIGPVTLTLTEVEFYALHDLIQRADRGLRLTGIRRAPDALAH
jgi:hypothetical protein